MTKNRFVGNKCGGNHSTTELSSAKDTASWQQLKPSPADIYYFLEKL